MISKVLSSSYKSLPDSEQISDPVKVSRLLERLTKRYIPITVQVPDNKEHYTSCIIGVDEKYVLLDELLPATGHQLLVTERKLLVTGKLDGIDIQFFSTLERVDDKDKLLTYYIKLPTLLEYRQRRMGYRVRIPMTMKLPVFIDNRSDKIVRGEMHDLSYSGAGMILLADNTIMEIKRLHECAIKLPDGTWIYCTVEFRYSRNISSKKTQFIGVQFVDLLPVQSQLISRCINELERESLRLRAAY